MSRSYHFCLGRDWCWTFIVAASDPAALHEVIRLVECFVASEDFAAQCLAGLKSSGAAEQLIFIVSNTLSGQLCERAARLMAHLVQLHYFIFCLFTNYSFIDP